MVLKFPKIAFFGNILGISRKFETQIYWYIINANKLGFLDNVTKIKKKTTKKQKTTAASSSNNLSNIIQEEIMKTRQMTPN